MDGNTKEESEEKQLQIVFEFEAVAYNVEDAEEQPSKELRYALSLDRRAWLDKPASALVDLFLEHYERDREQLNTNVVGGKRDQPIYPRILGLCCSLWLNDTKLNEDALIKDCLPMDKINTIIVENEVPLRECEECGAESLALFGNAEICLLCPDELDISYHQRLICYECEDCTELNRQCVPDVLVNAGDRWDRISREGEESIDCDFCERYIQLYFRLRAIPDLEFDFNEIESLFSDEAEMIQEEDVLDEEEHEEFGRIIPDCGVILGHPVTRCRWPDGLGTYIQDDDRSPITAFPLNDLIYDRWEQVQTATPNVDHDSIHPLTTEELFVACAAPRDTSVNTLAAYFGVHSVKCKETECLLHTCVCAAGQFVLTGSRSGVEHWAVLWTLETIPKVCHRWRHQDEI